MREPETPQKEKEEEAGRREMRRQGWNRKKRRKREGAGQGPKAKELAGESEE